MELLRYSILICICASSLVVFGNELSVAERSGEQRDDISKDQPTLSMSEAENDYQKGIQMLLECKNPSLGDPSALKLIASAAKVGHVKALEAVATASALAWGGLPLSINKAVEQFRRLADEGNPRGQLGLGILYAAGIGVNVSVPQAIIYLTFAALGGDELAEMAMGYRYLAGIGVESNCETALAYYRRVAGRVAEQVENRVKAGAGPILMGPTVVRINLLEEREQAVGGTALSNYFISDDILSYYKFVADSNNVTAQRAAESGSSLAMAYLGEMYLVGSPQVPRDEALALNYLQRAVSAGNPMALTGLGLAYLHGRAGLTPDPVKAMDLFVKAADQGWPEAQLQLGLLFMGTLGWKADYKMALKYFTLASQQGNTLAFYNLGQMHATGMGVFRSCNTATELFKNVAERGRWSQLLTSAYLEYWSGNHEVAFLQYAALAELGYEVAQSNAALILEEDNIDFVPDNERYKRAFVYWKRSSAQGSSTSRVRLGDYHFYGLGTEVNYEQAIQEYRFASDVMRNAQAMFNLGYMHEHGLGFKRDIHLAKRFYDMAAATSSDAQIPAALALAKLSFSFAIEFLRKFSLFRSFFGIFVTVSEAGREPVVPSKMDWDFYVIPLLAGVLSLLIIYMRFLQ
ncbi:hypothetical protein TcWFU_001101 [Taenia crassiceps]|uniref:Uncharacterized protein n=1 Tax=Taenia crassiceps TaxID=6207 RepID=A0ABR4QFK2_9CEST